MSMDHSGSKVFTEPRMPQKAVLDGCENDLLGVRLLKSSPYATYSYTGMVGNVITIWHESCLVLFCLHGEILLNERIGWYKKK